MEGHERFPECSGTISSLNGQLTSEIERSATSQPSAYQPAYHQSWTNSNQAGIGRQLLVSGSYADIPSPTNSIPIAADFPPGRQKIMEDAATTGYYVQPDKPVASPWSISSSGVVIEDKHSDRSNERWTRGPSVMEVSGRLPGPLTQLTMPSVAAVNHAAMGRHGPPAPLPQEVDSETEHMSKFELSNRTRQKKFVKNFKQLPSEEIVLQRYSCALVGDILLQGHLYVTKNYIAFHSNVFGYVTKIQIPMTSVVAITKEKTAKIIPNAVGVSTDAETHMFSSLISREATFKVMTKAWKNAMSRTRPAITNGMAHQEEDLEDDFEEEEEEVDGDLNGDADSTDSMVSATNSIPNAVNGFDVAQIAPLGASGGERGAGVIASGSQPPFHLMKRASPVVNAGGTGSNGSGMGRLAAVGSSSSGFGGRNDKMSTAASEAKKGGAAGRLSVILMSALPGSSVLAGLLSVLLVCLLASSFYLVLRLDSIQERVEQVMPGTGSGASFLGSNMEQLTQWQRSLHHQSSRRVQEYLDSNLAQIAKVRENLEKLSRILSTADWPESDQADPEQ